jgi:MICOS complex subunit MIC60
VPVKTEVSLGPGGPNSPVPKAGPPTPSSTNVPTTPPSSSKVQTTPPTSISSTGPAPGLTPPPKPASRTFKRLRFLLYVILASALGYGGAVFYALRSDNFHDFFTEYVPFGEESVGFFEERAFHKRFPNARQNTFRTTPASKPVDHSKVTIPAKSGLSWRVSDEKKEGGSDLTQKGKHMSATDAPVKQEIKNGQEETQQDSKKTVTVEQAKKNVAAKLVEEKPKAEPKNVEPVVAQPSPAIPSPKSDPRPPVIAPVTQLSPLEIANADEPLVQELIKIVNDIVTAINADSVDAANKYSAPIAKAKETLVNVGAKILTLKETERKAAEEQIQQAHKEFDEGAKQLLQRIETAQRDENTRYQAEFEAEREKLSRYYEERFKTEIERTQQVSEQRLKNELTEQAIEMKRKFIDEIKLLVESERDGRLSKLSDLSSNVNSLTELTSNWNGIIDSNLATQKLQVAVDAVRSALSNNLGDDRPKPFVREMAALKLVADGDSVVDAAIASINPTAYQKGIPSPAQLIDRFRHVATEVRKASLLPEDAGIASHAASLLLSKVMFKKHGQPQGGDVESVLTRTETMLEEGDLDGAAREMNMLKGWAGVLSQDWLKDCRKVLEVRQALDVIEAEAKLQCLRVE